MALFISLGFPPVGAAVFLADYATFSLTFILPVAVKDGYFLKLLFFGLPPLFGTFFYCVGIAP